MKRVILSSIPVLGMAYERKFVKQKAAQKSDKIKDHILKCIVYPNNAAYNHWIKEISGYIASVNSYTVKPKNRKLTSSEYNNLTFKSLGEDEQDAEAILYEFYSDYAGKPDADSKGCFSYFDITDELISKTHQICREIESLLCTMLSDSSAKYSMTDFSDVLHDVLDKFR